MTRLMANGRKAPTLKPFPWQIGHAIGADPTRLAHPELVGDVIQMDGTAAPDGHIVGRRARVFRAALPPVAGAMSPPLRAGLLDYAEAVATVGASRGTSDPTGGGGGSAGGAGGPSLRALKAAERLRRMDAALAGGVMEVSPSPRVANGRRQVAVSWRQLVHWVAVDALSRAEVLRRMELYPESEAAQTRFTLAVTAAAQALAVCCGHVEKPGSPR